jgi:hypothetical protein
MAKNSGKQLANGKCNERETKGRLDDELDALFKLPLPEFIAGRKALAAQLKQSGRRDDAGYVMALVKPTVSAWAVNQLYWQHREAFDQLIETGQRFRKAQSSGRTAKAADMREALDARRKSLLQLSDLAAALLRDAGSSATPEMIHRISTTLEGMSAYASFPDDLRPGRLSRDVDPPGFESFASLIPAAGMTKMKEEPARVTTSQKSERVGNVRRKAESAGETSRFEQTRQAKIAAAKVAVQEARSLLTDAKARVLSLETAQKKANAEVKEAEKHKRDAEALLEKTRAASQDAIRRAQSIATEAEGAVKAVAEAKRTVERAAKELEKLVGQ